jgi:hypothetical protein
LNLPKNKDSKKEVMTRADTQIFSGWQLALLKAFNPNGNSTVQAATAKG